MEPWSASANTEAPSSTPTASPRRDESGPGDPTETTIPFLKAFTVFNAEQIDGLPERFSTPGRDRAPPRRRPDPAGRRLLRQDRRGRPPRRRPGLLRPWLRPRPNAAVRGLHRPGKATTPPSPTSTRTGPATRAASTGTTAVSASAIRVTPARRWSPSSEPPFSAPTSASPSNRAPDHASYIKSWLEVLQQDKRFIVTAAAAAQRACDFLHDDNTLGSSALE